VVQRFRRVYGASPLHLLALFASLLICGAALAGWFDDTGTSTERILIWFVGAIVGHDLVLVPLYSLLDRIAFGAFGGRGSPVLAPARAPAGAAPERSPGWVYVRVPAMLSGLLGLVFFPEILRLGNQTFHAASGMTQDVYLVRFLLTCGGLFAISAVAYAVSVGRARRAAGADESPDHPDSPASPASRASPASPDSPDP
jgi:hypothetical protein